MNISYTLLKFSKLLVTFLLFFYTSTGLAIENYFTQGKFEQAIEQWETDLAQTLPLPQKIETLLSLATTYQISGFLKEAKNYFLEAQQLVQDNTEQKALVFMGLSDLALSSRQYVQARHYADESLIHLPEKASAVTKASVLNNVGNVLIVEAYYEKAIEHYQQAQQLAKKERDWLLCGRIAINIAQVAFKNKQFEQLIHQLQSAYDFLQKLPDNYHKAFSLISISELAQRLQCKDKACHAISQIPVIQQKTLFNLAYQTLEQALNIAEQQHQPRLLSYALGYLGQLYEQQQRYDEALKLTHRAIFAAQEQNLSDILYHWEWQLGRILYAQKKLDKALNAYRQAISHLQPIRQELTLGYRRNLHSFRTMVGAVYFELADLLLQQAKLARHKNKWLLEARDTIESLKTVELQNYFQDDCVTSELKHTLLDKGISNTAVIYPILLPERLEILLSLPSGIELFTVDVNLTTLKDEVNEFRFELETRGTTDFLVYAQRLYQWLITPLEKVLKQQKIQTLVIVPDNILRTIPLAALHDGKNFLIEKYAVVTSAGLTLTNPKPIDQDVQILLSGLAKGVQNYPELASVREEIDYLNKLYQSKATVLLDETFTLAQFSNALEQTPYSIIHIASHGEFDSDANKTFLLTHDDKLTINQLEKLIRLSKIRNEPVELLSLSACQTAVGDDQAALGLAGIALKSGARSALATLWSIDDQATTELIKVFYRQLKTGKVSKAKALQTAQQYMLQQTRYQHPAFWAAFLLVGNWL